ALGVASTRHVGGHDLEDPELLWLGGRRRRVVAGLARWCGAGLLDDHRRPRALDLRPILLASNRRGQQHQPREPERAPHWPAGAAAARLSPDTLTPTAPNAAVTRTKTMTRIGVEGSAMLGSNLADIARECIGPLRERKPPVAHTPRPRS